MNPILADQRQLHFRRLVQNAEADNIIRMSGPSHCDSLEQEESRLEFKNIPRFVSSINSTSSDNHGHGINNSEIGHFDASNCTTPACQENRPSNNSNGGSRSSNKPPDQHGGKPRSMLSALLDPELYNDEGTTEKIERIERPLIAGASKSLLKGNATSDYYSESKSHAQRKESDSFTKIGGASYVSSRGSQSNLSPPPVIPPFLIPPPMKILDDPMTMTNSSDLQQAYISSNTTAGGHAKPTTTFHRR